MYRDVGMLVPKTTETRYMDGSVQALLLSPSTMKLTCSTSWYATVTSSEPDIACAPSQLVALLERRIKQHKA